MDVTPRHARAAALAASLLLLPTLAPADLADVPAGRYVVDKTHAYITFTYNHLGFSSPHVGFDRLDATLELDQDDIASSSLEVSIDATSINSRVAEFDEHLNGDKFFDSANFPVIRFTSTAIEPTGEATFNVTGDLTIKDVTKPVTLAATINKAANHPMRRVPTLGVSATATLLRSEWNLGQYAPGVSDEVSIDIEAELSTSAP